MGREPEMDRQSTAFLLLIAYAVVYGGVAAVVGWLVWMMWRVAQWATGLNGC